MNRTQPISTPQFASDNLSQTGRSSLYPNLLSEVEKHIGQQDLECKKSNPVDSEGNQTEAIFSDAIKSDLRNIEQLNINHPSIEADKLDPNLSRSHSSFPSAKNQLIDQ